MTRHSRFHYFVFSKMSMSIDSPKCALRLPPLLNVRFITIFDIQSRMELISPFITSKLDGVEVPDYLHNLPQHHTFLKAANFCSMNGDILKLPGNISSYSVDCSFPGDQHVDNGIDYNNMIHMDVSTVFQPNWENRQCNSSPTHLQSMELNSSQTADVFCDPAYSNRAYCCMDSYASSSSLKTYLLADQRSGNMDMIGNEHEHEHLPYQNILQNLALEESELYHGHYGRYSILSVGEDREEIPTFQNTSRYCCSLPELDQRMHSPLPHSFETPHSPHISPLADEWTDGWKVCRPWETRNQEIKDQVEEWEKVENQSTSPLTNPEYTLHPPSYFCNATTRIPVCTSSFLFSNDPCFPGEIGEDHRIQFGVSIEKRGRLNSSQFYEPISMEKRKESILLEERIRDVTINDSGEASSEASANASSERSTERRIDRDELFKNTIWMVDSGRERRKPNVEPPFSVSDQSASPIQSKKEKYVEKTEKRKVKNQKDIEMSLSSLSQRRKWTKKVHSPPPSDEKPGNPRDINPVYSSIIHLLVDG